MTRGRSLLAVGAWLFFSSCTRDSYVIGAVCPALATCPNGAGSGGAAAGGADDGAGGDFGVDGFVVELSGSGVERLPPQLFGANPSELLIADDATQSRWPARVGTAFATVAPSAVALAEASPFADPGRVLSHAGALAFSADANWADTSAGALALEAVFRAEPGALLLSQTSGSAGLQWSVDDEGRANLRLSAASSQLVVASQALVPDAWHHCLALFDASQGAAQMFCNGQAGSLVDVPPRFALANVDAPAVLGDASPARVHWAELARWQASNWGARDLWSDVARERFARLVGTYAENGREPLPFADVRASGAYLDMTPSDAPEQRRLHPVGKDWPRIVCRPTNDAPRTCGLLVEAASSQPLAPAALALDQWAPLELSVAPASGSGPTGSATLRPLSASPQVSEHTLELAVPFADGPAVLSFFARPAAHRFVRADVVGVASATFDLATPSVVESTHTAIVSAEAWGDGLVRLSYAFEIQPGPGKIRLALLADDRAAVFAGGTTAAVELGDVQLCFRSYSTPLPTFGAIQQADRLVYPAGNGNLPAGPAFQLSAEVWLAAAPLVADAAIVNANFAARGDQQINLFVRPADGSVQFWGLQGKTTPWQFSNPKRVTDGNVHRVTASVELDHASLRVDDQSADAKATAFDLSVLDRLELGASTSSSGALTGIVRRVRLSAP